MPRHPDKVRENRLRRMADRQGLVLRKSPRRDPLAVDFDLYSLTPKGQEPGLAGLDLDAVEAALTGRERLS